MRKSLFAGIFVLALVTSVSAQKKSKQEIEDEKAWAAKLKSLKPMDYKKLVEEKDALSKQVSECENSKTTLRTESEGKDAEISKLKKELEDYNSGMVPGVVQKGNDQNNANNNNAADTKISSNKGPVKGVVYKVQIGSFRNKDLSKYFDNNPNFSGEVDQDGLKKYTLGLFTDYWEADKFKKALREMGVKDAWVVPYKDGKRVALKDVLEGAL